MDPLYDSTCWDAPLVEFASEIIAMDVQPDGLWLLLETGAIYRMTTPPDVGDWQAHLEDFLICPAGLPD